MDSMFRRAINATVSKLSGGSAIAMASSFGEGSSATAVTQEPGSVATAIAHGKGAKARSVAKHKNAVTQSLAYSANGADVTATAQSRHDGDVVSAYNQDSHKGAVPEFVSHWQQQSAGVPEQQSGSSQSIAIERFLKTTVAMCEADGQLPTRF